MLASFFVWSSYSSYIYIVLTDVCFQLFILLASKTWLIFVFISGETWNNQASFSTTRVYSGITKDNFV